jgi:hypothetical protein
MFRYLFGSEGAYGTPPATFSASFPGAYLSLFRPKMLFFISPTHIAAPPAKELTNHIATGVPFVVPAPITFMRPQITRASIATVVNSQGLIKEVPADNPRFDHDLVTLAPKGLLLKEERTNLIPQSVNLTLWLGQNRTVSISTSFPFFADGSNTFEITGTGTGYPSIARSMASTSTTKCLFVFLRRGTNNFAQFYGVGDPAFFVNFHLLAGTVRRRL